MRPANSVSTGYADVPGARLYYEMAGEGHPLVLLHGGLVNHGLWDPQFSVFGQRYTVVRYDFAGFGKSGDPAPPYSHMEQLGGLLRRLGIERAHVLALSMSGTILLDFALAYPDLVTAAVHAAGGLSGYTPERFTEAEKDMFDAEEAAWERGDIEEAVDITLQLWTVGPNRKLDQVDPSVCERVREMSLDTYRRGERPPGTPLDPPAAGRLGEIRIPTLVVHGDEDVAHVAEVADVVVTGVRGARKVVIPGAAHHLNLEKPDEFNRVVLEFLGSAT